MAGESVSQGWRVVARGFRGVYDHMGATMIVSSLWFFIGLLPTFLTFLVFLQVPSFGSLLMFVVVGLFLLGPATGGAYSVVNDIVGGGDFNVRTLWPHFKRYYKSSVWLSLALGAILAVLVVDLVFFLKTGIRWMQFVAVLWMYFLLFWFMVAQYAFPLLVDRRPKVLQNLKMASLLALDNIVATLMVALAGVVVGVVCIFLRVPLMIFLLGTLAFLHCEAFREIIGKYNSSNGGTASTAEGETTE